MHISGSTYLGLVAAFCSTTAYLPQVVKTWRTRSTHDISRGMFALVVTGAALWLAYGILQQDAAIIAANIATFALTSVILYFKLRYG